MLLPLLLQLSVMLDYVIAKPHADATDAADAADAAGQGMGHGTLLLGFMGNRDI